MLMTDGKNAVRDNKHKTLPTGTVSHTRYIPQKNQENTAEGLR